MCFAPRAELHPLTHIQPPAPPSSHTAMLLMTKQTLVLQKQNNMFLKNMLQPAGSSSGASIMTKKDQDQAHTTVRDIVKSVLKGEEEKYKGNGGFVKDTFFTQMSKENGIYVARALKDLDVNEGNLLLPEFKQFLKRITGHKIKARRYLYKTGVTKGPEEKRGTRLLVKKNGEWAPFVEVVVEVEDED